MSNTKFQAVAYMRNSYANNKKDRDYDNNGDRKPSDTIENQRKMISYFVEKQPEISLVSEKIDDGVSGLIFDRKAFKEMMADIESGTINCVIVKDLSRFGREYIETGRYLRNVLPAYGVRFIAINDNIDTLKDSADDLVVGVKSIINDAYCRDISVKTRSALNVKRENGDYVGACPIYGYRRDKENKNQLAIDEYPASIVRDIYRMKIDGMSALKIAETLNAVGVLSPLEYKRDRGLPHPTGGFADRPDSKWSATAVIRILKDETYTGTLIQGRQGTPNYKINDVVNKPTSEWKRTEDAHDFIISKQDFILVQRIMRLDTRTAPGNDNVYLFSGILICGCCGARMTRKTVPYKGKSYYYYYCPTGKKRGCDGSVMLKEADLNDCILESVKAHILNIASLGRILSESDGQKAAQALARQYRSQIDDNNRQIEKIAGFKATLYENMVTDVISKKEYKELKARYTADENRLRAAAVSMEEELGNVLAGKTDRLRWMEQFKQFEELAELDRRAVITLIQNIKVMGKTELEVTFAYQSEYEQALAITADSAQYTVCDGVEVA